MTNTAKCSDLLVLRLPDDRAINEETALKFDVGTTEWTDINCTLQFRKIRDICVTKNMKNKFVRRVTSKFQEHADGVNRYILLISDILLFL